jgi:hypothetical protein
MLNGAARSAAGVRLQCRNPSSAVVKKKPRKAGLKVLRGNGGVLFRDFGTYPDWRPELSIGSIILAWIGL